MNAETRGKDDFFYLKYLNKNTLNNMLNHFNLDNSLVFPLVMSLLFALRSL